MILYYYCVDFVPHPSTTEERHYTCKTIEDVNLLLRQLSEYYDEPVWSAHIHPAWMHVNDEEVRYK